MNAQKTVAKKKTKRRGASLERRKARAGWFFVLPFVLGFLFVYLPIIVNSATYSFAEIKTNAGGGGFTLNFVGFENYKEALFVNPTYVTTLISGIQQLVFDIPAIVIFALFMAVLLNQKMFGRAAFRAIFFVPVIISTGLMDSISASSVVSHMESAGMNDGTSQQESGVAQIISAVDIQALFSSMKVGAGLATYVAKLVNDIYNIVNRSGVQLLIFLAALQGISPAIYESCSIDGASAWETFWKITIPMISPMILVNAVYTVIDAFTDSSNTVMTFIDSVYTGSSSGRVLASAMSWMYFLIVIFIIAAVALLLSLFVFYQRRD
ncbi:MAG: sugar ABC transporter permease [Clostridia bacterium]|nr:sugar ABC transporter permease [Clostridia bacterium]